MSTFWLVTVPVGGKDSHAAASAASSAFEELKDPISAGGAVSSYY